MQPFIVKSNVIKTISDRPIRPGIEPIPSSFHPQNHLARKLEIRSKTSKNRQKELLRAAIEKHNKTLKLLYGNT